MKKILVLILFGLCFGQNVPPFDGNRAMYLLQTQCDFGPRFPESEGHEKMKRFMVQFLQPLADSLYIMDEKIPHPYKRHYITLTNLGKNELKRIVEQRMTPLYISVHATDPELRKKLLLYKKHDNFLDNVQYLIENGIELHCQVVLIPGQNDGDYLLQTIQDLYQLLKKLVFSIDFHRKEK